MSGRLGDIELDDETMDRVRRLIENIDVLNKFLEAVKPLVESGALETLVCLGYMVETLKSVVSDEMVSSASELIGLSLEAASVLRNPHIHRMISALGESKIEFDLELRRSGVRGIVGLVRLLKDEDVIEGIKVLLVLLKILGRRFRSNASS